MGGSWVDGGTNEVISETGVEIGEAGPGIGSRLISAGGAGELTSRTEDIKGLRVEKMKTKKTMSLAEKFLAVSRSNRDHRPRTSSITISLERGTSGRHDPIEEELILRWTVNA
jgi:hypothetical protein